MPSRDQKYKFALFLLLFAAVVLVLVFLTRGHNFGLFNPKGPIALQERNLLITAVALMAVVAIPMFAFMGYVVWKYRVTNSTATYAPNHESSTRTQVIFWGILATVILILSIINWNSSHALDPYKPIASATPAMTIQVVALRWKWLFIYPAQNIATVNFVEFPSNTPINFQLTSDAPINSFWIPQLGGQMYAMAGMSTQLHLMASVPGEFNGSATEINGAGYSDMKFTSKAVDTPDFNQWVSQVKQTSTQLDLNQYDQLAQPSLDNAAAYYSSAQAGLYYLIMTKYMTPTSPAAIPDQAINTEVTQ